MTLVPLFSNVFIRPYVENADKSETGMIVIPNIAREKPTLGSVVARGADANEALQEGVTVLFGKFVGSAIRFNGEDLLLMRDEDVSAIVVDA